MRTHTFSELPAVDQVEVVDLRGASVSGVTEYMDVASADVVVSGAAAQAIAALWRSLPAGDQDPSATNPFRVSA